VMIDIFSRYIIGAIVHTIETAILAEEMMREVFNIHGTPKIVLGLPPFGGHGVMRLSDSPRVGLSIASRR
jgi:hypothetical protein